MQVISTKDAQGQQFIELKNRIDVGLEKLFGKMNMVEVKSSGHSEQDEFKITNLEKTLVDRLDNVAEKILKLEDRTTRIEELWTKHLNRISQTISRLQVCTKEQSVDFLRKRFEDSSTMADDATAFRTSSGGDLREESELSENVHGTNFSYQTNMPRQQTFDTDTADVISVFPTVPYGWNNITEMLDETLKVIETKFKEVDSNLEIYTRKTFNAYQELLNDSKGIDDYLSKIVNQDNQTRVIVREGFRKLFHHMKPLSSNVNFIQSFITQNVYDIQYSLQL